MPQLPPPYLDEYQQRHKVRAVLTDHLLQVVLTEGPILDIFQIRFLPKRNKNTRLTRRQFQYPQYARNDDKVYVRLTDPIWTLLIDITCS